MKSSTYVYAFYINVCVHQRERERGGGRHMIHVNNIFKILFTSDPEFIPLFLQINCHICLNILNMVFWTIKYNLVKKSNNI